MCNLPHHRGLGDAPACSSAVVQSDQLHAGRWIGLVGSSASLTRADVLGICHTITPYSSAVSNDAVICTVASWSCLNNLSFNTDNLFRGLISGFTLPWPSCISGESSAQPSPLPSVQLCYAVPHCRLLTFTLYPSTLIPFDFAWLHLIKEACPRPVPSESDLY